MQAFNGTCFVTLQHLSFQLLIPKWIPVTSITSMILPVSAICYVLIVDH